MLVGRGGSIEIEILGERCGASLLVVLLVRLIGRRMEFLLSGKEPFSD